MSIGYRVLPTDYRNPVVEVANTTFYNNSALSFRSSSDAFYNGLLTGRAGGLGVFINEPYHNVTITVVNCQFIGNYARVFGGGLYFVYSSRHSQHIGIVKDTIFIDNIGELGGGGFITAIQSNGINIAPHFVKFDNCSFINNRGDAGAGMYFYVIFRGGRGNKLQVNNCMFINNRGIRLENEFGAALAASIYEEFQNTESFTVSLIKDW